MICQFLFSACCDGIFFYLLLLLLLVINCINVTLKTIRVDFEWMRLWNAFQHANRRSFQTSTNLNSRCFISRKSPQDLIATVHMSLHTMIYCYTQKTHIVVDSPINYWMDDEEEEAAEDNLFIYKQSFRIRSLCQCLMCWCAFYKISFDS